MKAQSFHILGCRVDALGLNGAVKSILETIDDVKAGTAEPAFVVTIGTEMIVRAQQDEIFRQTLEKARFSLCDTIGVLLASRLRGGPLRERVVGVSLAARLCELLAKRGQSVYFFGAAGDTAEAAAIGLKIRYPQMQIAGHRNGYFRSDESSAIAGTIRDSGATLLLVALGSPKQEEWIARYLPETGCAVAIGVGGAFDVFSGRTARAPHIWQTTGLEWLYRLIKEPHRWRRQLALPKFVFLAVREGVSTAFPQENSTRMKAMLLAGGMSTRLYPLTKQVPKPLVPIAGEPNAGHLMRYLNSYGIEEVAINVFYLAEKIVAAFRDGSRYNVRLNYLHEEKLSGSAGALKQMEAFFRDGTFVVIGCDAITDVKLDELIAFHREKKALASIALFEAPEVDQFGVVVLDDNGRIQGFQEKPKRGDEKSHLVNTGIYIFEPGIFDLIPAGEFYDFGNNVFPALLAANLPFYGLQMKGAYWADIGTLAEFRRGTEDVLSGKIVLPGARATGVAASSKVAASARIDANVRVGERAQIGENVVIQGPSVVGNDTVIEAGVEIRQSILFDGVTVGKTSKVTDSILGLRYAVGEDQWVQDAVMGYENDPVAAG